MTRRTAAGWTLVAVGSVGVVVALVVTVFGWRFLRDLERPVAGSVGLTSQTVDALGSSLDVAEEALVVLEQGLRHTQSTTRDLAAAFEDAEAVADATADLSDDHLADSLDAMEAMMPTLVDVGGVIDRALGTLSAAPFVPDYRPSQPVDASLRSLHGDIEDLSQDLRRQTALLRQGSDSLTSVREGTIAITRDMEQLQATLGTAVDVLREYSAAATRASSLVEEGHDGLARQLALGRILVVVIGAALLVAQTVPLGLGWVLLRPEAAAALVAESG